MGKKGKEIGFRKGRWKEREEKYVKMCTYRSGVQWPAEWAAWAEWANVGSSSCVSMGTLFFPLT